MKLQLNTHLLRELLQRLYHMKNLLQKLCINSEELLKITENSFELWQVFSSKSMCLSLNGYGHWAFFR